jgi:sec-independent protein translocase protein TatB
MLDMSWGEVMVIGAVALIVIGPKDLPRALRTVGQVTGKLRRMAAEFQGQFNEAMREAELDDVRKELQSMNSSASNLGTNFNPIQTIRDELKGAIETPTATAAAVAAPAPEASAPVADAQTTGAQATGDASIQAIVEGRVPAPAEPMIDLPPPPDIEPAEAIAESLRREAEIEAQKAAAASHPVADKTDTKA